MIRTLGDQQQGETPTRTPHPAPPRQDYMGQSLCKEHKTDVGIRLRRGVSGVDVSVVLKLEYDNN